MTAKDLEIALTLIVLCTIAALALRYFTSPNARVRKLRIPLVIIAALAGGTALLYHRDSITATTPAACEDPGIAEEPAGPPDPRDVYHLRQRICWNSPATMRS